MLTAMIDMANQSKVLHVDINILIVRLKESMRLQRDRILSLKSMKEYITWP